MNVSTEGPRLAEQTDRTWVSAATEGAEPILHCLVADDKVAGVADLSSVKKVSSLYE